MENIPVKLLDALPENRRLFKQEPVLVPEDVVERRVPSNAVEQRLGVGHAINEKGCVRARVE